MDAEVGTVIVIIHGGIDHHMERITTKTKLKTYRKRSKQELDIQQKIDLLQYFDPLIQPSNLFVIDDDVFYDTKQIPEVITQPSLIDWTEPIPSAEICAILDLIDVISHYKQIQSFENVSFFNSSYGCLQPSSAAFQSILIQARHLKAQVFHYDTTITSGSESATEIYISSCKTELPIVIDTGASNSITPIPTDFVDGIIHKANLQSLTQVNAATPVCGQGPVKWPIEDVIGTRRTITTDAYYVPDAGIRLFSPQVYISKNKTANMQIDHNGICFTSKCGTLFCFPFNKSNNLPFMLTETSLRVQTDSHLSSLAQLFSNKGFYTSLIDRSVLNCDNFNLNPAQQELLTWHC
jgi:hypothetical protein